MKGWALRVWVLAWAAQAHARWRGGSPAERARGGATAAHAPSAPACLPACSLPLSLLLRSPPGAAGNATFGIVDMDGNLHTKVGWAVLVLRWQRLHAGMPGGGMTAAAALRRCAAALLAGAAPAARRRCNLLPLPRPSALLPACRPSTPAVWM